MKKYISFLIIAVLILSAFQTIATNSEINPADDFIVEVEEKLFLSTPFLIDNGDYYEIFLDESESKISEIGKPDLPVVTKVFVLPFGSKIHRIDVSYSEEQTMFLEKKVLPFIEPSQLNIELEVEPEIIEDDSIYMSNELFPSKRYDCSVGSGLENDQHVMILRIQCYPVRYSPQQDLLYYSENIELNIAYEKPENQLFTTDESDLLIIAPQEYASNIAPLIEHKEKHNLKTSFITTESIYSTYQGRDQIERIKYCIKEHIEDLGINYVLLIGSVYKLPIRTCDITLWGRWEEDTLTDLYYADIYDANGSFSSWDTDNDNNFGESEEDIMDFYPDVYIGRLACDDITEVQTVVDKIIHYEDETYNQDWFNNMIFIGGNTFQWSPGNEGEELNEMIMEIMSGFNPSHIIWTSKGNFNRKTISGAISEGAGFLDYSGHGFEHGMGTYPPNGLYLKTYLTPYVDDCVNGYKLPIIFFDACLTAKLDFVLQDVLDYKQYRIFNILAKIIGYDTNIKLPCYAWYYIRHQGGGAIATIGATRTAFGGTESGAGKLSLEFFETYESSETLGQMMVKMQNSYINDVPWDEFTLEEFILLGDPSLRIGGYP